MGVILAEHQSCTINFNGDEQEYIGVYNKELFTLALAKVDYENLKLVKPRVFKVSRKKTLNCFNLSWSNDNAVIEAGYYIGVDWLGDSGRYLQIEPKLNSLSGSFYNSILDFEHAQNDEADKQAEEKILRDFNASVKKETSYKEIDYLKMLLDAMTAESVASETKELVLIDWEAQEINIHQNDDKLTPFLIVHFLNLLRDIVRKGLKKSYYKVQEHLTNRIKGKILISGQIKQNILKNRFTKTYCEYQVFGVDHLENRFLKTVLQFCSTYIETHATFFGTNVTKVKELVAYNAAAFEQVGVLGNDEQLRHFKYNPFYKEYKDAIKIGEYILKRFSYHISQASKVFHKTPPFWIDMPRLFELYVYQKLLIANPLDHSYIHYQFNTYGNSLDYLIGKPGFEMVIDAKYKKKYASSSVHEDIRQVSGYARLNKVLKETNLMHPNGELKKVNDQFVDAMVDCLIIYPDLTKADFEFTFENICEKRTPLKAYHKVYKLGVSLPLID